MSLRFAALRDTSWLLVAGCLAGAFAGCFEDGGAGPGLAVGATWQNARDVVGHRVHVVEEKIACSECHDLSGGQVDVPKPAVCTRCHEQEAAIEHGLADARKVHGDGSPAACTDCHAYTLPEHGEAPRAWDCMRCHAEPQGDASAVMIHKKSTCDTCHRPHDNPPAEPSDCKKCHQDVVTAHALRGDDGVERPFGEVCSTCHQDQHAPATQAGERCAPCHAEQEPPIPATALFAGHDACIGCHRPHDYAPENAVACRSCHENTPVLGGGRVPAHADCNSCHDAHAPKSGITRACVTCHTSSKTDHPAAHGGEACSTCHAPHPAMGQDGPARACSNCHAGAASENDYHGAATSCRDCHRPHQFKVSVSNTGLCGACHQGPVAATAAVPEHGRCTDCHAGLPHRPLQGSADCGRCHGAQQTTPIIEHRACRACHEPHGGSTIATCDSCHEQAHRQAPAGHRACTSCHTDAHVAAVTKACTTCHADKVKAPHATTNGGCESCHSAHGPKGATFSASCQSCHAPQGLPGLHATAEHQTCRQCHASTHATGLGNERKLCGTCHQGMDDHEPDAPRCASCHLFK